MGKISNTSQYPTVVPQSADYVIGTDADDNKKTKTFTIGSMAGAVLGLIPSATLATDDKFIGLDTSDGNAPKQFLVSQATNVMLSSLSSTVATSIDALVGLDQSDSFNPKQFSISDVTNAALGALPTAVLASDDTIIGLDTSNSNNPTKFSLAEVRGGMAKIFEAQSAVDQDTTSANTAVDISFGAAQDTTDISVDANGLITFKTTGDYFLVSDFQVGINVNVIHQIDLRYLVDSSQIGATRSVTLTDSSSTKVVPFSFPIKITSPNTELKFQFSAAAFTTNGGLRNVSVSTTGFNDSSSAGVIIYKRQ